MPITELINMDSFLSFQASKVSKWSLAILQVVLQQRYIFAEGGRSICLIELSHKQQGLKEKAYQEGQSCL